MNKKNRLGMLVLLLIISAVGAGWYIWGSDLIETKIVSTVRPSGEEVVDIEKDRIEVMTPRTGDIFLYQKLPIKIIMLSQVDVSGDGHMYAVTLGENGNDNVLALSEKLSLKSSDVLTPFTEAIAVFKEGDYTKGKKTAEKWQLDIIDKCGLENGAKALMQAVHIRAPKEDGVWCEDFPQLFKEPKMESDALQVES